MCSIFPSIELLIYGKQEDIIYLFLPDSTKHTTDTDSNKLPDSKHHNKARILENFPKHHINDFPNCLE